MRILLYSLNFKPELTGVGKYSGEMAHWFANRGHDIRVVCAPPYYPNWKVRKEYSGIRYRSERDDGVSVFRCPIWVPGKPTGLKRLLHLFSFAISSAPMIFRQFFWQPDVVVTVEPTLFCSFSALLLAKVTKAKSVLHVQDLEVDAAFDLGIVRGERIRGFVLLCERFLLRQFHKVSTISEKMRQRLLVKGLDENHTVYFPNWVDTDFIKPINKSSSYREELGISDTACVVLYSGNFGEKQGVEILVAAARQLSHYSDIQFVFCGSGSNYNVLKESTTELNNIKWLPLQEFERLNDLLNLADIHLLPQKEGAADLVMPSKLSGMMASGKPVIATANEGTEVATAVCEKGIVVPPGDLDAFCREIVDLSKDEELRESLGQKARAFAVDEWGSESVLSKFEKELLEMYAPH